MKEYKFTYGVELEFADIDTRILIPEKIGSYDYKDYSVANSNGLAIDPKKKWTLFGSEVHIAPAESIDEAIQKIDYIFGLHKNKVSLNYTCNLHVHIGLRSMGHDLNILKKVFNHIYVYMPIVLKKVDPLPFPSSLLMDVQERKAYLEREKRRKVSHHYLIGEKQYNKTMNSESIEDFKDSFGKIPTRRCCVNMRSIFKDNRCTIEFRHFTMSLDLRLIRNSFVWCDYFVRSAFDESNPLMIFGKCPDMKFQAFHDFDYGIDKIFTKTGFAFTHSRRITLANIEKLIKSGELKIDQT